jgi:hypothetical protein
MLVYFVCYMNSGLKHFSVLCLLTKNISKYLLKNLEPTIQPHTGTRKVLHLYEICVLQRSKTDVFQFCK